MLCVVIYLVSEIIISKFCRTPVLEKASRAVWELIVDNNGLGKEISETVERVYCRLNGRELPPPVEPSTSDTQVPEKEKETIEKKGEKVKETEMLESLTRKRTFSEMNVQEGTELVSNGTSDDPPVPSDDAVLPHTNSLAWQDSIVVIVLGSEDCRIFR